MYARDAHTGANEWPQTDMIGRPCKGYLDYMITLLICKVVKKPINTGVFEGFLLNMNILGMIMESHSGCHQKLLNEWVQEEITFVRLEPAAGLALKRRN